MKVVAKLQYLHSDDLQGLLGEPDGARLQGSGLMGENSQ